MARLICVDVGSHAVKVALWRQNRGRWEPDGVYRAPVPQDGGLPTHAVRLGVLRELVVAEGLAPRAGDLVVNALPGEAASFHRLSVPFTDRAQIERTLPFAIEAEVPFDLADMTFGWRVVSSSERTGLLVVLTRSEALGGWLAGLQAARLDPAWLAVDGEVVGTLVADRPGTVAVIDVGHAATQVSVLQGGTPVWVRTLDVAGLAFTRAIQGALSIPYEDAERLKHGEEEPTDGGGPRSGRTALPEAARAALDGMVGLLLAEVRATLVQAEDVLGTGVDSVVLTGGSARMPELWDWLAADLGVRVDELTDQGAGVSPGNEVIVGLGALATTGGAGRVVDMRVGAHAYRGGGSAIRSALTYGGTGLLTFTLAALLLFVVQYRSLSVERDSLRGRIFEVVGATFPEVELVGLEEGGDALELMAGLTEDAQQRAELLGKSVGVAPTVELLDALFGALPPIETSPVDVSELVITRENVEFQGEAAGYAESAAVEEKLKATPRFARVTKGAETRLPTGRVRFPITIPLGDPEEEEETSGEPSSAASEEGE